jgi:hypothetical protein
MIRSVGRAASCVALTAAVLAGCGASAPASTSIEKTQALAYAHAVNLRAADLPGWTSAGPERQITKRAPFVAELARCGGAIYPRVEVGGIGSLFRRGPRGSEALTESGVLVTPSADIASRDVAANRSARVQACVARVVTSVQPRGPSGTRPVATISPLPNPLPGVESYGVKVIITAVGRGGTVYGRQDVLGFASGPAVVALTVSYVPKSAHFANERQLLSLLYSRATAHKLGGSATRSASALSISVFGRRDERHRGPQRALAAVWTFSASRFT